MFYQIIKNFFLFQNFDFFREKVWKLPLKWIFKIFSQSFRDNPRSRIRRNKKKSKKKIFVNFYSDFWLKIRSENCSWNDESYFRVGRVSENDSSTSRTKLATSKQKNKIDFCIKKKKRKSLNLEKWKMKSAIRLEFIGGTTLSGTF